jgi:hypothetical protein
MPPTTAAEIVVESPGNQNSTRNAHSDPIAQAMNGSSRQSALMLAFGRSTYWSIRMMAPARRPHLRAEAVLKFSGAW